MKKLVLKLSHDVVDESFNNIAKVIELEQELDGFLFDDLRQEYKKHGIQYSVLNDTLKQLQAFKNILNEELSD